MSAAHTVGPWHAGAIRTHGANPSMNGCDIGAENGANVAIALHQPQDREVRETVANARLISAAPDLLAALQILHDNIDDYQRRNNLGGHDNQDMRMARAAIAKATQPC